METQRRARQEEIGMAFHRVKKTDNYTRIYNELYKRKDASVKAKGLLSLLLSLPDHWNFSLSGLESLSSDGRESLLSGVKELERLGYLKVIKKKGKNGQFFYEYEIYESCTFNPQCDYKLPELLLSGDPPTEEPSIENQVMENCQRETGSNQVNKSNDPDTKKKGIIKEEIKDGEGGRYFECDEVNQAFREYLMDYFERKDSKMSKRAITMAISKIKTIA